MRYYPGVSPAIPHTRAGWSRVTHPFAGYPLRDPRDLHVLSTPPAFVLSQDQTLQENLKAPRTRSSRNAVSIGPRPESIDRDLISRCSTRKPQLDESHRTNVTLDCQTATCIPKRSRNPKSNGQRGEGKGEIPIETPQSTQIVALPNETPLKHRHRRARRLTHHSSRRG